MSSTVPVNTEQTLRRIHAMLRKLDALPMPWCLRPRVEAILVRQAAKMMDGALPWQRGHGQRTAELARRIGSCAGMSPESLHHLALAARLHDIGLLPCRPLSFHMSAALMTGVRCPTISSTTGRRIPSTLPIPAKGLRHHRTSP